MSVVCPAKASGSNNQGHCVNKNIRLSRHVPRAETDNCNEQIVYLESNIGHGILLLNEKSVIVPKPCSPLEPVLICFNVDIVNRYAANVPDLCYKNYGSVEKTVNACAANHT